jgi:hypothetical protein
MSYKGQTIGEIYAGGSAEMKAARLVTRRQHPLAFDTLAIPAKNHDAPPEPIKTLCIGGPWAGASITHLPDDHRTRPINASSRTVSGKYVWTPANPNNALYPHDTWRWHLV